MSIQASEVQVTLRRKLVDAAQAAMTPHPVFLDTLGGAQGPDGLPSRDIGAMSDKHTLQSRSVRPCAQTAAARQVALSDDFATQATLANC